MEAGNLATFFHIDYRNRAVAMVPHDSRPIIRRETESHRALPDIDHHLLSMQIGAFKILTICCSLSVTTYDAIWRKPHPRTRSGIALQSDFIDNFVRSRIDNKQLRIRIIDGQHAFSIG